MRNARQTYILTGPDGRKYKVDNLGEFAEANNLTAKVLYSNAARGSKDSKHHEWKIRYYRNRLSTGDYLISEYTKPQRKDETKRRACLKCRRNFLSSWNGNRLCRNCYEWAARQSCTLI